MSPTDVDECGSPETNSCHSNALCTNTEGSYVCRCLRGYNGDGQNCTGKCVVQFTFMFIVYLTVTPFFMVMGESKGML